MGAERQGIASKSAEGKVGGWLKSQKNGHWGCSCFETAGYRDDAAVPGRA
jgi:hypothetical protein